MPFESTDKLMIRVISSCCTLNSAEQKTFEYHKNWLEFETCRLIETITESLRERIGDNNHTPTHRQSNEDEFKNRKKFTHNRDFSFLGLNVECFCSWFYNDVVEAPIQIYHNLVQVTSSQNVWLYTIIKEITKHIMRV